MTYRLTRAAEADIVGIYLYGLTEFGSVVADRYHSRLGAAFELLAEFPRLAVERKELVPAVRVYPVGSHLVIYLVEDEDRVLIIRVRHQSEDWTDPYSSF